MTTRFVNRFVRTKQYENQFVLWTKHNAQNEMRTPDLNSFCVSPKGTHTKRIRSGRRAARSKRITKRVGKTQGKANSPATRSHPFGPRRKGTRRLARKATGGQGHALWPKARYANVEIRE